MSSFEVDIRISVIWGETDNFVLIRSSVGWPDILAKYA